MAFISGLHTLFPRLFLYCSESAQPQASLLITGASWQVYCSVEFVSYLFLTCLLTVLVVSSLVGHFSVAAQQTETCNKGASQLSKRDAVCKKVPDVSVMEPLARQVIGQTANTCDRILLLVFLSVVQVQLNLWMGPLSRAVSHPAKLSTHP